MSIPDEPATKEYFDEYFYRNQSITFSLFQNLCIAAFESFMAKSIDAYAPVDESTLAKAAPDLLEACKSALSAFDNDEYINWNELRIAIYKAEGKGT